MRPALLALALLALALAACGDNSGPSVHLVDPDAAIDVTIDACSRDATVDDCCVADQGAAAACARARSPGICGDLVCWQADCTLQHVPFCSAIDAGVDAIPQGTP